MTTMQALRFVPGVGLGVLDLPVPTPGEAEVLIEVEAAGLCGTDVSVVTGKRELTAPVVLGHETSGSIVAVGPGVTESRIGERVLVAPIVVCGRCPACATGPENLCKNRRVIGIDRDGGLAQFVLAPAENALPLPEGVSAELGAITVDAVATPFHALKTRAKLVDGESIAILGVGGLGQHAVQIAAAITGGAVVAVDVREAQLEFARTIGATAAVPANGEEFAERLMAAAGGPVDVVLDCAGVGPTLDASLAAIRLGGRAVRLALEHKPFQVSEPVAWVRREISLVGSLGFTRSEIREVLEWVVQGRITLGDSISHHIARTDVERVLTEMAHGVAGYRRVVVR